MHVLVLLSLLYKLWQQVARIPYAFRRCHSNVYRVQYTSNYRLAQKFFAALNMHSHTFGSLVFALMCRMLDVI